MRSATFRPKPSKRRSSHTRRMRPNTCRRRRLCATSSSRPSTAPSPTHISRACLKTFASGACLSGVAIWHCCGSVGLAADAAAKTPEKHAPSLRLRVFKHALGVPVLAILERMEPPGSSHEDEKIERLRRAMYSRTLADKLGERPRRELGQTRPLAGEDWHRPEPTVRPSFVAPRTLGLMRTGLWWVLGISLIFFLGAAAFFGYYFTIGGGSSPVAAGNIDIAVAGPAQIAGGEPTQLQISVTNRN